MLGKNPITKPSYREDGALRVKEIFYTIQGEGPRAGQPAVFVRLGGCNLRCFFCDTDFDGGHLMEAAKIVSRVTTASTPDGMDSCTLVVLTGGEPMAQQILPLVQRLGALGWTVQVETAGTCVPPPFGPDTVRSLVAAKVLEIVCSPKTPKLDPQIHEVAAAFKYLVRAGGMDKHDGLPIESTQIQGKQERIARPLNWAIPVYLQPIDEPGSGDNLQEAINLCMKFGYRLSIQQHKIIGMP